LCLCALVARFDFIATMSPGQQGSPLLLRIIINFIYL
jgi:hypothetical protein